MTEKLLKNVLAYYDTSTLYEDDNKPGDFEFEQMAEECHEALTDWIKAQASNYFYCWIHNFGWRNVSLKKVFKAERGEELLQAILPETDCTYYIYEDKENDGDPVKSHILRVLNYHHDSPTGETYYIRLATEKEVEDYL